MTSCRKITHANGYYGAWPGWAVSMSVLHLPNINHPNFYFASLVYRVDCAVTKNSPHVSVA